MNTLTLLFLLITVSVSFSKLDHHHGGGGGGGSGFTVDLIHRDSPLSPLYNPTYTRWYRLQNAFLRSISRASRLSTKAGFSSSIDADISAIPGEYVMCIQIGNSPVEVVGIVDTGSDLTWAQCQPCKTCYNQGTLPFLQPNDSSTYRNVSSQSDICKALDTNRLSGSTKNVCEYRIRYGDGSHTIGDLGNDTFWFGSTSLKNVVFGCGHDNNGTFTSEASGIIGLGGGPLSIINQLNDTVHGKFAYCLVSAFNNSTNVTGKIHFGDHAMVSGPGVVWTPLRRSFPTTYYYVVLENLSVGNRHLPYKTTPAMKNVGFRPEFIIVDSGTTLTLIAEDFYGPLHTALIEAIGGEKVSDPQGIFSLCYKDLNLDQVPTVTFHFTGANVTFPPANTFMEVQKGLSCLTIVPSGGSPILGNLLQQNFLVGFDLVNNTVSFRATDCRNHN